MLILHFFVICIKRLGCVVCLLLNVSVSTCFLFYSACLFATAYEAVLERYDPGDLILSGIRQRKISPSGIIVSQACFKTPVGFYVYDSVGGSIGKDFGRIEEIGENYVILNEVFEDKIDEWVERRTKIILSKESECDWKNSIPNIGIPPED